VQKRIEALAVGLLVVGIAALLLWPEPPEPDRVTQENFDRISDGMSRAEVEAILGPPGDSTSEPPSQLYPSLKSLGLDWDADTAWVSIGFDDSGGVVRKRFYSMSRREQGPLDNLLWRAKRQWRRWFPEN
jgi:hypothetical protein